jgi:predicted dehydrogenase
LRQFRELGVSQIDAYRTGRATLPDDGQLAPDRVFQQLDVALAERPDVVVVSNPTSLHLSTALAAVRAGCHVLVEKPLADRIEGCEELAVEARTHGVVVWAAFNVRYHPVLRRLRELVQEAEELGPALLARFHFGAYLPSWHPWEDFRTSYAARRELGGGVGLTHIHEIDAALWLFGPAAQHCGLAAAARPLGTDVTEAAAFLVRHRDGVLSAMTLSFAERPPSRIVDVSFRDGTFSGDLVAARWTIRREDGRVEQGSRAGFEWDETYRDQARDFVAAVRGEAPVAVPVEDAVAALKVALSMEIA